NQDIYVSASQLAQTTYQSGSGTDTLWVRAYDGTLWSAWSASFTVTAQNGAETTTALTPTSAGPRAAAARAGVCCSLMIVSASDGTSAMTTPSASGAGARNAAASAGDWGSVKSDGEADWRLVVNPSDSLLGG